MKRSNFRSDFLHGVKIGLPICLGYFAVAFSLGITAKSAGLTAFQGALTSLLLNASAGEYVAFSVIAAGGGYLEIAIAEFIANARYLLMSCALSQRLSESTKLWQKLIMSFAITDEMFGSAIAQPKNVSPYFYFGMMSVAMPGWCFGTWFGIVLGNVLPSRAVSALSVSLFGMFIAIIVPEAKKSIAVFISASAGMALSLLAEMLPLISKISSGTKIIILTVVISSAAALICPVKDVELEVPNER